MNVFTIRTSPRALRCAWFTDDRSEPLWQQMSPRDAECRPWRECIAEQLTMARRRLASVTLGALPDAVGIHLIHGGDLLHRPVRATPDALDTL